VGYWGILKYLPSVSAAGPGLLSPQDLATLAAFFLYAHAYALTSLFLHRTFFPQRTPMMASLLTFAIPALFSLLPCLVLFLANRLSWDFLKLRQLGSVFNLLLVDEQAAVSHVWFAAEWSALAVVVNLPWFIRQARSFRPPERTVHSSTS
jgi:hypothetical protein